MSQFFIIVAGVFGALGVSLAAVASHTAGATSLGSASSMLLFHAPALLAIGLFGRASGPGGLTLNLGGLVLLVGAALFAGDLAMRFYKGTALFPMAAPTGGTMMIAGWAVIVVAGILLRR
ncbi:DUF423 domain-containing protein [Flaviflagellibacter deserti]|uniref:DUF423 domain-containing protein n=1 Tax=Flaviflagellibacter deserti TaxID=2267266 RepID=A0ABV9YWP7_9HYPH